MASLSAFFYFISQHSILAFPLWIIAGFALGAAASVLRKSCAWLGLGAVGFVVGFANIFLGSAVNAIFVNANGTYGTAVITQARETNSQLNDSNIWEYDVVMKTADGRDVKTGFDTMSASLYPPRNAIEIPPTGERFVVKYIPGFERNIAIMRDESPSANACWSKKRLGRSNGRPLKSRRVRITASFAENIARRSRPSSRTTQELHRPRQQLFTVKNSNAWGPEGTTGHRPVARILKRRSSKPAPDSISISSAAH
jgi:hypothetical protein